MAIHNAASNKEAPQHDETRERAATDDQQGKTGVLRTVAKGTGKLLWKGAALDVLYRDTKRVRPLNPRLWKDVFSRRGWDALKAKFAAENAPAPTGVQPHTSSGSAWLRIVLPSVISAIIGMAVAVYGLTFVTQMTGASAVPLTNKLIALSMTAIGLLFAISSSACAFVATVRLIGRNKPQRTRAQ